MSDVFPASHRDLLDGQATGFLTTVNPDGSLQTTAIWFTATDTTIEFSVVKSRKKFRNLDAHPNVSLAVLDPATPWRWISVSGTASVTPDDDRSFMATIGEKYATDISSFDPPGAIRVKVTITPTKVLNQ
jgi:PPOX class probable F420-dependent enzyme